MKRWVLILCMIFPTAAGATWDKSKTLVNCDQFFVMVERLDSDAQSIGLTEDQIKTETEFLLRSAGLPVADPSALLPFLYVRASVITSVRSQVIYTIEVRFRRPARIEGMEHAVHVFVWDDGDFGNVGSTRASSKIREILRGQVMTFANDFMKANPREPAAPTGP